MDKRDKIFPVIACFETPCSLRNRLFNHTSVLITAEAWSTFDEFNVGGEGSSE